MGISESFEKAIDVLKENSTENGFLASETEKNNYKRVWSRDGVVQGLAALMSEDKSLIDIFRKNLLTLKKFQDKTGRIASNIDVKNKKVSYGTLVGKIDATLWYIIGVGQYFKYTRDEEFLEEFIGSLDDCINYLYSLELNGKGLLFIPTGGDWADEYISHGYVLFDQLLYLQALREYRYIMKKTKRKKDTLDKKINLLENLIEVNYFPSRKNINSKYVYHKRLYKKILNEKRKNYPLAFFSSTGFGYFLDSFGCCLFLLLYSDKKNKKGIIKNLNSRLEKQKIKILPAFWPPLTSGHPLWNRLKNNALFEFRNKPHKYHNGGLWPLIQGFFISALVNEGRKKEAKKYLQEFSDFLEKDKYKFHEYIDSKTYKPEGIERIGFSAAGYVIAYLSLIENKLVFKQEK